jgi:four helix bundle protein
LKTSKPGKPARVLRKQIHATTRSKPFAEDRDLQRQMTRAALSAMSNIAEGFDGGTDLEFRRFLRTELHSHLYAALDERCLLQKEFDALYEHCVKVKSLIGGFIRYLRGDSKS